MKILGKILSCDVSGSLCIVESFEDVFVFFFWVFPELGKSVETPQKNQAYARLCHLVPFKNPQAWSETPEGSNRQHKQVALLLNP